MLVSMSTRRVSAKAMKVQRPSRLTVVMRANMVAHEPVASMRYPEKYTMRTPAEEDKVSVKCLILESPYQQTGNTGGEVRNCRLVLTDC